MPANTAQGTPGGAWSMALCWPSEAVWGLGPQSAGARCLWKALFVGCFPEVLLLLYNQIEGWFQTECSPGTSHRQDGQGRGFSFPGENENTGQPSDLFSTHTTGHK